MRHDGIFKKHKKELKEQFTHIQVLAYHSVLPHLKPSERKRSIDEIIPNIYEEKPTKVISLKDRYAEIMKKYRDAGILKDTNGSQ